jgi:hypothetical protein
VILYRVLGGADNFKEGWFTYRGAYKTPDGSNSLRDAVIDWLCEGPGADDFNIKYSPESAHRPPCEDPFLAPFWNSFYNGKSAERNWTGRRTGMIGIVPSCHQIN